MQTAAELVIEFCPKIPIKKKLSKGMTKKQARTPSGLVNEVVLDMI
jgi:hypothetical protein